MFEDLKYVHFIGIGGIGMSALARYFNVLGIKVSGYDRVQTTLTDNLKREGIAVYFDENLDNLPKQIRNSPGNQDVMIVYTPAIPSDHIELMFFREQNVELKKRAEVLGMLSQEYNTVSIAGTHGKTSTTSLLVYIFSKSNIPFIGFIGGINNNLNTNLVIQENPKVLITEADEYDRSFLNLNSQHAIITSLDADHLDFYQTAEAMKHSFLDFAQKVSQGNLMVHQDIASHFDVKLTTYSLDKQADYHPVNIVHSDGRYIFNLQTPEGTIDGLELSVSGEHNLENSIAAIAMAGRLGVAWDDIRMAIGTYKGVRRRFDYRINTDELIYIDDYAHHPEEINRLIQSVRTLHPGKRITGVFQPHLYSRTRDFGDAFARSLEGLDELVLLEIYPAREKPIKGITAQWLIDKVNMEKKMVTTKEEFLEMLPSIDPNILLTIGAGDIDQLVRKIETQLKT